MKIAALLTGRGNNTLKDKNVLPVLGKPLLYYPAMAAKTCNLITDFYVSSDDEKILKAASDCGYKKIVRPVELAAPTSQHVDAIRHALGVMKQDGVEPDILVVLLANSGIVKTEWIEESITQLLKDEALSASVPVLLEMDNHPYRSKRLREDGCLDTWFDFRGISLILAGAIGNIIDSVFYGVVFNESTHSTIASFVPVGEGYSEWLHGKVVDMFYFPIIETNWPEWIPGIGGEHFIFFSPIFNFADAAISCGIVALLLFYGKYLNKNIHPSAEEIKG